MKATWPRPAYEPPYAAPEPPRSVLSADCVCVTCAYWRREPRSAWGTCHARTHGEYPHLAHEDADCPDSQPEETEVAS